VDRSGIDLPLVEERPQAPGMDREPRRVHDAGPVEPGGDGETREIRCGQALFSKSSLPAPQTGQTQSAGSFSKGVPGFTPPAESP